MRNPSLDPARGGRRRLPRPAIRRRFPKPARTSRIAPRASPWSSSSRRRGAAAVRPPTVCSPRSRARGAKAPCRSTPSRFTSTTGTTSAGRIDSRRPSTPLASARTRARSARGACTRPEMIVDGRDAFVGSDRDRALDGVARALGRSAVAAVSLHARRSGAGAIAVDYDVKGAPAGSVLSIVVVDRAASVAVRAGENAGKRCTTPIWRARWRRWRSRILPGTPGPACASRRDPRRRHRLRPTGPGRWERGARRPRGGRHANRGRRPRDARALRLAGAHNGPR